MDDELLRVERSPRSARRSPRIASRSPSPATSNGESDNGLARRGRPIHLAPQDIPRSRQGRSPLPESLIFEKRAKFYDVENGTLTRNALGQLLGDRPYLFKELTGNSRQPYRYWSCRYQWYDNGKKKRCPAHAWTMKTQDGREMVNVHLPTHVCGGYGDLNWPNN